MSDKRHHLDPRKAFPTWTAALRQACAYGSQTGRKYRIRYVAGAFRIQRTDRPYTGGFDFAAHPRWSRKP